MFPSFPVVDVELNAFCNSVSVTNCNVAYSRPKFNLLH